jgi:ectoine hydroxylase-related dioxygenase (phytanoyl-CoA dioxygenase family)
VAEYWTEVNQNGFAVLPDLLNSRDVEALARAVSQTSEGDGVRKRNGVYAIRNLLQSIPEIAGVATSPKVLAIARRALGNRALPVKATLFDKTPDANWLVPWHQDLTITVGQRVEMDGYGPWTIKAGVVNVQPPGAVLEGMLAIRIHLDDCEESNGPLRVLPGTHRFGRLSADRISSLQAEVAPVTCAVRRGGGVLMKPLLLHASSAAARPSQRRVVHIDFAAVDLPVPLSWLTDLKSTAM